MSPHITRVDERHRRRSLSIAVIVFTLILVFDPVGAAAETTVRGAGSGRAQDREPVDATTQVEPAATAPGPSIEVIEAGWAGMAAPSTWTPVRLRVTAGDQDVHGLAEVVVERELRPAPQAKQIRYPVGAYGREVAVAAGSSLAVMLWVPADGPLEARLSSGAETLAETAVRLETAREGWPLIAVLAEAPAVARALASIELPYQGLPVPLAVADLEPRTIPASSQRFEAASALVVQGAVTAELTGSQRDAVLDWVRQGGHLVIAGGPGGAQSLRILPEGELPITYGNAASATPIGGLGGWLGSAAVPPTAPAATFRAASGGTVLAGDASAPLAWRAPLGRGTVTVLAVDPGIEPLASWPGNAALLRAALAPALATTTDERRWAMISRSASGAAMRLQAAVNLLPPEAHPRWTLAGMLLAGFAAAVGPVLYLVLRLLDRRELSWIAVPAAAIGLSLGLYVWGAHVGGRDLITNVASTIEIGDDDEPARQSIAAGFYGAMRRELTVPLAGEPLVRPLVNQYLGFLPLIAGASGPISALADVGAPAEPPFQVIDGADRRVRFATGQYTTRAVLFETERTDAPRIHAELTVDGGLLTGVVRNETGLPLEDAAILVATSVARLGALAPGQSAAVRLDPSAGHPMLHYQPLSQRVFGEPVRSPIARQAMPSGYPEPRVVPNDAEIRRRASFLDAAFTQNPFLGPQSSAGPLTFIAYTKTSTVDEVLRPPGRIHHLTLLRQRLELMLEPGPFILPPELTPPEMLESSGSYSWSNSGRTYWIELGAGSIAFAFRPPLPAGARVETLLLETGQIGTAPASGSRPPTAMTPRRPMPPSPNDSIGPADADIFSVYDWGTAEWRPLPRGSEHRLEASAFVGPDGDVRVRVSNPGNVNLRFIAPSLTIEGVAGGGNRQGTEPGGAAR